MLVSCCPCCPSVLISSCMLIPWSNKQLDMVFSTCVCVRGVCACVCEDGGTFLLKLANEETLNTPFSDHCCEVHVHVVLIARDNPPTCCYGNIPTCCCSEVSPVSGRAPVYDGIPPPPPPPPPPGTCVLVAMGAPHPPVTCWACCWNAGGCVCRGTDEHAHTCA